MSTVSSSGPDILSLQVFVARTSWSTFVFPVAPDVMTLLARIIGRESVIAPMSQESYPTHRLAFVIGREVAVARLMDRRGVVSESVNICTQRGIPQRATVAAVHENADREVVIRDRVIVGAGGSVIGVRSFGAVRDGANAMLFDEGVVESFTRGML